MWKMPQRLKKMVKNVSKGRRMQRLKKCESSSCPKFYIQWSSKKEEGIKIHVYGTRGKSVTQLTDAYVPF